MPLLPRNIFQKLTIRMLIVVTLLLNYSTLSAEYPPHVHSLFTRVDSLKKAGEYIIASELISDFLEQDDKTDSLIRADLHYTRAVLLKLANRNSESVSSCRKAADLYHAAGYDNETGDCFSLIGENQLYLGNYDEALASFNEALKIDEALNNPINKALTLNSIGKVYEICKDFDKAVEFYNESLKIVRQEEQPDMIALRLASIASIYKNRGQYNEALNLLKESIDIETARGNTVRRAYRLDMTGEIYTLKKQYTTAEKHLNEALKIFSENKLMNSQSIVLNHLAFNAFRKGETSSAISYYQKSLEISRSINFRNMLEKNHQELSGLYEEMGDYKNSLKHFRQYIALRDSSITEKTREQLLDFQVRYETEEKEKELALANQEKLLQKLQLSKAKQIRNIIITVLALAVIMLISVYSRYLIKKRSQAELALLNKELNELNSTKDKLFSIIAHDLKNNINAFSNLLTTLNKQADKLRPDNLKYFLGELQTSSGSLKEMLRNLLGWAQSQRNKIVVEPVEIEAAALIDEAARELLPVIQNRNIRLENLVDETLTLFSDKNILLTIIRNIISNAIKYSPDGSSIVVGSSASDKDYLQIMISDRGMGMSQELIDDILEMRPIKSNPGVSGEKGSGLGLRLCLELIEKISAKLQIDSTPGKGSTFTILIPQK